MGQSSSRADLADILATLSQTEVSPEAHDFWDELWKLSTTPEDIFELIPPEDVRSLKKNRPENVVTLFTQAVAQLCQIVHTPVPMYFGQALNCVRILTRLLPFLVDDDTDFAERLCWSVEDCYNEEEAADDEDRPQPLARLVIHAAMHLLFLPGFTVDAAAFEEDDDEDEDEDPEEEEDPAAEELPPSEEEEDGYEEQPRRGPRKKRGITELPQQALWAAGMGGFEARPALAASFDRNRVEVLRLLLSAVCEPLFQSAESYDPWRSRWLETATDKDAPNSRLLFYSLCNVVFSYDPTGFGVPYGGALFSSEAPTILLNVATQVLVALLDFGRPTNAAHSSSGNNAAKTTKDPDDDDDFVHATKKKNEDARRRKKEEDPLDIIEPRRDL
mmetsp:Transcript_37440/g.120117  ORF Transcript_37440/g.120117 Transcript_37440/m.120117 type:complete len:388 (-) Transcript_37440:2036-3199(-)